MGRLLALPSPLRSFTDETLTFPNDPSFLPGAVVDRDALRQHMKIHSLKGHLPMAKARTPFIGEILTEVSPSDKDVEFGIRRVGNKEYIEHQNLSSIVRYIQEEDGGNRFISEKDYPVGSMKVDTILLGLARWNITNESGHPIDINRDTLLAYTEPDELEFLHEKVLEHNPILAGKEARKKD